MATAVTIATRAGHIRNDAGDLPYYWHTRRYWQSLLALHISGPCGTFMIVKGRGQ